MISLSASRIAEIIGGELFGSDCEVSGNPTISSRDCTEGSIFLALNGENVDGHDFATEAFGNGAVLAITSKAVEQRCIVVADVIGAVSVLAHYVRVTLSDISVIGITGSQGKTTTKELLAAILEADGETVATTGNNNNEIGVPLTLLRCKVSTKYCIVEMGARHKGDISALAEIALPHVGVVLKVAAAHLGEFGSIENIAKAKSELISSLTQDGVAVLGQYDEFTPQMRTLHHGATITFGETPSSTIRATDIELRDGRPHFDLVTPEGRSTVALRQYGLHQIPNALAAASVAHLLGISTERIAGSLSTAEVHAKWRMEVKDLGDLTLINDTYNASPDSMAAALRTLAHLTQERGGESWAFLGNMRELGESSENEHALIGTLASNLGIDHLVAVAAPAYARDCAEGSAMSLHICSSRDEAELLFDFISPGDVVLCKASRSDHLELLAARIEDCWSLKSAEGER